MVAQIEIQAGPHRFVSLITREAADELELAPGVVVDAVIKATNVSVEIPERFSARRATNEGPRVASGSRWRREVGRRNSAKVKSPR